MDLYESSLVAFFGRLHVAFVHFPIALILAAAWLELVRARRPERPISRPALACLGLGALGAVLSATSGWVHVEVEPYGSTVAKTVFFHRWLGVASTVLALAAWVLGAIGGRIESAGWLTWYRRLLVLSAITVGVGSHFGGSLVHGHDYFTEPFEPRRPAPEAPEAPEEVAPPTGSAAGAGPSSGSSVGAPPEPVGDAGPAGDAGPPADASLAAAPSGALWPAVEALLAARCTECHGERKAKGKLRLHDLDALFADETQDIIVRGRPEASYLMTRVQLPDDDYDRMPPEDPRLTSAEVELLRAWIAAGAPHTSGPSAPGPALPGPASPGPSSPRGGAPAGAGSTPEAKEAAAPSGGGASSAIPARLSDDPEALAAMEALRERGARAAPVAAGTDEVEVTLGPLGADVGDAELAWLVPLAPRLAVLDLSGTAVTDAGLAALPPLPVLRRLRLDRTAVGDGATEALARCERLVVLNLVGTRVTGASVDALARLPALKHVHVWGSDMDAAAAERLRELAPGLAVHGDDLPDPPAPIELVLRAACCDEARAAGGECDHPCCVEARAEGDVCPDCGVEVAAGGE